MKTILVIDDEYAILDALRVLLEDEGYRVLTAEDGAAGLEALGREKVDAVVLDLMMPRMDGRAVLAALRSSYALRDVGVCVISAAGPSILRELRDADAVLPKPFTFAQLRGAVERALGRERRSL